LIDKFVCNSITWGGIQYSRNFGAQNKIDYNSGYTVTLFAADDVDFLFGIGWESLLPSLSISVIITAGRTASIIVGHNIGSSRLYWCLQTKNASEKTNASQIYVDSRANLAWMVGKWLRYRTLLL
jgi:hypothetical protein